MLRFLYYVFNLLVVLGPLIVLYTKSSVIRFPWRSYAAAVGLISVPFMLWDIWAARAGHWGFNSNYIAGPYIFNVPVEEYLFFLTVPFAMLFVWEVAKIHTRDSALGRTVSYLVAALAVLLSTLLLVRYWDKGYTRSVALAILPSVALLWKFGLLSSRRFWIFSVFHLALFFISNSFLTALPIITYGEQSYIGLRIGTIPVEDFVFSFVLVSSFVAVGKVNSDKRRSVSEVSS